ncbi:MAG TPA: acyl-CoA dehydrogenase family protein [Acidimicrobiales bacterium]|nr:acyl-CoA dehydrogenase family protein [Acidimicrobiales bacterium]
MDFDDTPEEAAFRAEAYDWLSRHASPRRAGSGGPVTVGEADAEAELLHVKQSKEWQRTLYDGGWAGITWPRQLGGRGGTADQALIFAQEQARFDVPSSVFAQGIGMAGPTIMGHGTEAQQDRFLPPMLRGDEVWCQLFSEPGAGSDLANLSTRAERDGDVWVVNGQKVWTSSAHFSDWGILLARTDVDAPKHRGITYFLLDMRSPGIEIRPLRQATGASHFNEVFLTNVAIPAANVVGGVNDGWRVTVTTLANERMFIGGSPTTGDPFAGLAALAASRGRRADPAARQSLMQAYIRLQVMKYLGWRTQTALSRGQQPGPESSVLKLAISEHQARNGDLVMQLLGAEGTLLDYSGHQASGWQLQFLGQFGSRIGGGTEEVQRNIIGERVLGLPGEPRVDKDVPFRSIPKQGAPIPSEKGNAR